MAELTLHTPVSKLPGIGPAREASLAKLGLYTVADLLAFFPRDYEDRTVRENIWTLSMAAKQTGSSRGRVQMFSRTVRSS